jgi:hypothetical protein
MLLYTQEGPPSVDDNNVLARQLRGAGVFGPPLAATPLKTLARTDWISWGDNTPSPSVSAMIIIIRRRSPES